MDQYETCVLDFLDGIMAVAGIDDTPTFTRSQIANESEMMTNLLQAAQYLPDEYVTRKVLDLLGDGDLAEELIKQMEADEYDRGDEIQEEAEQEQDTEENPEENQNQEQEEDDA